MNKFPFGIYKDKTLDEVASTNKGLIYLDSIVDYMKNKGMNLTYIDFYKELVEYIKDPNISKEIENALEEKEEFISKPKDPIPKKWWE